MQSHSPEAPRPILVLGFGNTLRSDDGVGPAVAEALAALALPGVRAMPVHQLFPELAEDVSQARAVIFVDASVEGLTEIGLRVIEPVRPLQNVAHACDPASLLGLARDLFGHCPPAWCLGIPVTQLGFGESLSAHAQAGCDRAVVVIREFTGRLRQDPCECEVQSKAADASLDAAVRVS